MMGEALEDGYEGFLSQVSSLVIDVSLTYRMDEIDENQSRGAT